MYKFYLCFDKFNDGLQRVTTRLTVYPCHQGNLQIKQSSIDHCKCVNIYTSLCDYFQFQPLTIANPSI